MAHTELDTLSLHDALPISIANLATKVLEHIETQPFIGRRIAHYELRERIGAGGMGDVYLAEDVVAGRKAAIKLLPARDRKSTRLNSSHVSISYAVFCLKKK